MSRWTAIVLAGSRPGIDRFAEAHGTDLKALIPVSGVPMVRWPVEALLASPRIGKVIVLAQQPERIAAVLPADPRLSVARSQGTIAATLQQLCDEPETEWPLLVTTGDHVLLDPHMIEDICRRAARSDVAIGVVERRALVKRLPEVTRTWIRFRGGAYSGANLFLLRTPRVATAIGQWRAIEQGRKSRFRLLLSLGPVLFLGAVLRVLTLEQVLRRIGRKLKLAVRAVELRNPLAAVDVDKPSDHGLAETILEGRA